MEMLLDELQHNQSSTAPLAAYDQSWQGRHEQIVDLRTKSTKFILDKAFEDLPPNSWEEAIPSAFELRDLILKPLESADIFGPYDPAAAKTAMALILPEAMQYPGSILHAIATIKDMREGSQITEESEENPWILVLNHPYDHETDIADESDSNRPTTPERLTKILEGIGRLLRDGIPEDPVLDPGLVNTPPQRRSPNELEVRNRALQTMPVRIQVGTELGVIAEPTLGQSVARVRGNTRKMRYETNLAELGKLIDEDANNLKASA